MIPKSSAPRDRLFSQDNLLSLAFFRMVVSEIPGIPAMSNTKEQTPDQKGILLKH